MTDYHYVNPNFLTRFDVALHDLRDFAVWCAEDCLRFVEDRYPNETRPRAAVDACLLALMWGAKERVEALRKVQNDSWAAAREIFNPGAIDLTRPVFAGGARDAADAAYFAAFVCGFVSGDTEALVAHYGSFIHPSVRVKHKAEFTQRYEIGGTNGN